MASSMLAARVARLERLLARRRTVIKIHLPAWAKHAPVAKASTTSCPAPSAQALEDRQEDASRRTRTTHPKDRPA